MKEQLKTIKNDISIVIEAIRNEDTKDAIEMLMEVAQDLEILELMC